MFGVRKILLSIRKWPFLFPRAFGYNAKPCQRPSNRAVSGILGGMRRRKKAHFRPCNCGFSLLFESKVTLPVCYR